ncbi:MAG: hydrogen peroxide-inducible genes activator [Paludibacter sp.]|jgi:LysR family hydrogen peroxide-inducible transcriptional activator|nr:hydrogen peroxide-inducible genes activator [Paludibacter sp.]
MNIKQLEYIVAVDTCRHFGNAAEMCGVTQPTLSMMIQKLEEELNLHIFDRSQKPVEPTAIGAQIIVQARVSLRYFGQIKELVQSEQGVAKGSFTLGIIPTIATYLVPVLLQNQQNANNGIELTITELTTAEIIKNILNGTIDGGILAGPLNHAELNEFPLYYEKFYAYVSPQDKLYKQKEIDLETVDIQNVWLLENEHCLRGQVERLCKLKRKNNAASPSVKYESGNIETLIHVVDYNSGITIIPEMHAMGLSEEQQDNLRPFKNQTAVREVSLIVGKDYVRQTLLGAIKELVCTSVPKSMQNPELKAFVVDL